MTTDPNTHEPKPYLKDRETLGHWAGKKAQADQLREYQQEWNSYSLDGLPGLHTALKDKGGSIWMSRVGNWTSRHRDEIELVKSSMLIVLVAVVIAQWVGYI